RRAERSPLPDAVDLVFQGTSWFNKGLTPDHMAQARSFFEKAMALDPENVEAMVGLARVDANLGTAVMTDDYSAALCGGREDRNQGAIPCAEPRFGSPVAGPLASVYETRGPRHRSMRARTGAGSQFGQRSCCHRGRKGFSWSRRRNRTSHQ